MAKSFAPRVSKRERKTIDLSERLGRDVFRVSDDKLLQGAKLDEVLLKDIRVKDQVRTKFNDHSIKELAKNIEVNGLIQPLVVHRREGQYTLICGERRYRAMTLINMEKAPCFILDGKSEEELMAIQFSENSSRESLHYVDKADGILNYQKATKASERKIQAALGISKSEVHRSLLLAKMAKEIKEAAKLFNIEKYVLLEFDALPKTELKEQIRELIVGGELTKRAQLKRVVKNGTIEVLKSSNKKPVKERKAPTLPVGLTANAFLKAMANRTDEMEIDSKTKEILNSLVEETKEMVDL